MSIFMFFCGFASIMSEKIKHFYLIKWPNFRNIILSNALSNKIQFSPRSAPIPNARKGNGSRIHQYTLKFLTVWIQKIFFSFLLFYAFIISFNYHLNIICLDVLNAINWWILRINQRYKVRFLLNFSDFIISVENQIGLIFGHTPS